MIKQFLTRYISVSSSLYPLQGWRRYLGSQDLGQLLIVRICAYVCALIDRRNGDTRLEVARARQRLLLVFGLPVKTLSSRVGCVLLTEDPTWVGASRVSSNRLILQ